MLRAFLAWAGDDSLLADVTLRDVELDFFTEWQCAFEARHGRSPSPSYVRCLRLALRSLFSFADSFDLLLDRDGRYVRNPLRNLDVPAASVPQIQALSSEAYALLLGAAHTARQKIILSLLRWTGMRVGETVELLDEDVDLARLEIRIRRSKSPRGVRTILILPCLEPPIREWRAYCAERGMHGRGCAFLVTRTGTPMRSHYVWHCVRNVAARAQVTAPAGGNISPHTLRRTFATDLLNRGVRLETVSKVLGHSSTAVTEKHYAHLGDERVRAEIKAAFELSAPATFPTRRADERVPAELQATRQPPTPGSINAERGQLEALDVELLLARLDEVTRLLRRN